MTALLDDLRCAIRMLLKAPGFATTALVTVALGIGVNIALFSVVNGVLLNPLAYPRASQLVALYEDAPGFDKAPISYLNFLDWQRLSQTCASMAIYRNQDYSVTGDGQPERLSGYMVSADFFRTLGQNPLIGRNFEAADDHVGSAPVVILGGGYWQRRFGSSTAVLGTSLTLNGVPHTVVGVTAPQFTFYGSARDVYTPIGRWSDPSFRDRSVDLSAHAIARLKPGETLARARADM